MAREGAEDAAVRATGRSLDEWAEDLARAGLSEAAHKEIAAYFEKVCGIDPWWAQQLTVQYEQRFRGRPLGRTADGGFQIGASRTFPAPARRLWDFLLSPRGLVLILGESGVPAAYPDLRQPERLSGTGGGIEYAMTTFRPYSHFRMRWKLPGWGSHSILQVRVTEQGTDPAKTTLTFHHEKLPDAAAREAMRLRWKAALDETANALFGAS